MTLGDDRFLHGAAHEISIDINSWYGASVNHVRSSLVGAQVNLLRAVIIVAYKAGVARHVAFLVDLKTAGLTNHLLLIAKLKASHSLHSLLAGTLFDLLGKHGCASCLHLRVYLADSSLLVVWIRLLKLDWLCLTTCVDEDAVQPQIAPEDHLHLRPIEYSQVLQCVILYLVGMNVVHFLFVFYC